MKALVIVGLALIPFASSAQKRILSLPFEFEKKLLATSEYDAYFLDNKTDSTVSLILKDNQKAEYLQFDKNLKILSKIDLDLNSTVLRGNDMNYFGGTTNGNVFNYIYQRGEGAFHLETVDYKTKTVTHRSLFLIPGKEKVITSFSDNNINYTITADNKASELVFYMVNSQGVLTQKRLPFQVAEMAKKWGYKLSEYLYNMQVFQTGEEPDFTSAISFAKLFCTPESFTFVIHKNDQPVHLLKIQLPDFSTKENFIDLRSFRKDKKEFFSINSYKKGEHLFSLIYNKKNLRLVIHNAATGELVHTQEINEESDLSMFAQVPMFINRNEKARKDETREIPVKKLISNFNDGWTWMGVFATQINKGQYIVTIGTHYIEFHAGGEGGWQGGWEKTTTNLGGGNSIQTTTYNSFKYYRPGSSSYVNTNNYRTSYCRLLLDSTDCKIAKGNVPVPVPDQIKEYVHTINPEAKLKATNQFSIGEKQYFGYYNADEKAYVVEEIQVKE